MLFRRATYSLLTGFENFDNNYNGRNIEYAICNSTVLFPLNFENMDAALCQYLYVKKNVNFMVIYLHLPSIHIIA